MKTMILGIVLAGASSFAGPPPPALKGLDPISLTQGKEVPGRAELRTQHGKFTYAFATKAHQQQFLADPDRYAIQGEGKCLHMNQMEGDPNLFKVVEGKIYLVANRNCLAGLKGDLVGYVKEFNRPRKKVAILLFPGVQIIDYTGPWEVFGEAGYDVFSIAATPDPLATNMGMVVTPNYTFATSPRADILVLPGGGLPSLGPTDPTVKWIQQRVYQVQITMSVCNGAFWLAYAGLLDGQRATTTANRNLELLAKDFPRIKVTGDERFVDNGRIITTAGLSSGIDGALHVIERLEGRAAAQSVALSMEYDWRPEGGYARGALADKYLRRLGEFDLPKDLQVTNGEQKGDRQRWERSWDVAGPQLTEQKLAELLDKGFARSWTKTGSSSDKIGRRTSWAFNGDDGKPWKGLATVKPAPDAADTFTLTVSVERAAP
jgi:putative intracellular protease/amidase/YHS domain-containing protein